MKWQFGRSESAHRSCPTCGGTGFIEDEPIIRPQSDFTTGTGSGYRSAPNFQPDEPIIRPQGDTDAGWERNAQGHWTQASSNYHYTVDDDIPPYGTTFNNGGGWERNAQGHWAQASSTTATPSRTTSRCARGRPSLRTTTCSRQAAQVADGDSG